MSTILPPLPQTTPAVILLALWCGAAIFGLVVPWLISKRRKF